MEDAVLIERHAFGDIGKIGITPLLFDEELFVSCLAFFQWGLQIVLNVE